jgi:hypothetical protein
MNFAMLPVKDNFEKEVRYGNKFFYNRFQNAQENLA